MKEQNIVLQKQIIKEIDVMKVNEVQRKKKATY